MTKTKIKNTLTAVAGLSALTVSNMALAAGSASTFSKSADASQYNYGGQSLTAQINTWIGWLTGFLLLVSVIIGLWWAFQILTAAGDEDKVKKGKNIIVRACLGLVAIFSIYMIMSFVISGLFGATTA